MNVSVGQVYVEAGVSFPFSHSMQAWVSRKLSSAAKSSAKFEKKYGTGFSLMVNLSAKRHLSENRIVGPAVFKKSKDVEFTLFLPFDVIVAAEDGCRAAGEYLLNGICAIFQKAGIDPEGLEKNRASIIEHLCSDPKMLTEPWPRGRMSSRE